MTADRLSSLLPQVATIVSAGPVVAGFIRLWRRPPAVQVLWGWVVVAYVLDLSMAFLGSRGRPNSEFAQLTHPVFAVTGVVALVGLVTSVRVKAACYIGTVVYLGWWAWYGLNMDLAVDFGPYTGPVLSVLLSLCAAAVLLARLGESVPAPPRDWVVIACLAVLAINAPAAAIGPVSAMLWPEQPELVQLLWFIRSFFLLVGVFLFTLAFLWTIPPRSSPGFSSSAG